MTIFMAETSHPTNDKEELSFQMKPWIKNEMKHLMWKSDKHFGKYYNSKQPELKQTFQAQFQKSSYL